MKGHYRRRFLSLCLVVPCLAACGRERPTASDIVPKPPMEAQLARYDSVPGEAQLAQLAEIVRLEELLRLSDEKQVENGLLDATDARVAAISLLTAQARLAKARLDASEVQRLLGEIVRVREEVVRRAKIMADVGTAAPDDVVRAEILLCEARIKLMRREP